MSPAYVISYEVVASRCYPGAWIVREFDPHTPEPEDLFGLPSREAAEDAALEEMAWQVRMGYDAEIVLDPSASIGGAS